MSHFWGFILGLILAIGGNVAVWNLPAGMDWALIPMFVVCFGGGLLLGYHGMALLMGQG